MKDNWLPVSPITINWAVTNRCNFKCSHCYSRNDPSNEIELKTLLKCIKKIADAGVLSINFGGGEPLLRKDLADISIFASQCGLRVSMNSNGFLISRKQAVELRKAGFSKIGISIDSHLPETHDSFRGVKGSHKKAVEALSFLSDAGIETSISTVICRINFQDVESMISFAVRNKASLLNFHNFKCSGLGRANKDMLDLSSGEWKEFYQGAINVRKETGDIRISFDDPIIASLGTNSDDALVKGSICGKLSLNIKSNGDITPCGFIPAVIGNIINDDLKNVWANSPELKIMRTKTPKGKCVKCSHYTECLGGCTARTLALTGDINNPDPHCWMDD